MKRKPARPRQKNQTAATHRIARASTRARSCQRRWIVNSMSAGLSHDRQSRRCSAGDLIKKKKSEVWGFCLGLRKQVLVEEVAVVLGADGLQHRAVGLEPSSRHG